MRTAPPVQVQIPRAGAWLAANSLLAGLAGWAVALWVASTQFEVSAAWWPPALAAGAASAAAAWRWWPVDSGPLMWDGRGWSWNGRRGAPQAVIDLGPWLLLRFDTVDTRRPAWLAASSACTGGAWHGLRAAVYSRRPDDEAQPDSEPTSAART